MAGTTNKERAYEKALSLILSLPPTYWVRMKADLDKASLQTIIKSGAHPGKNIDTICLEE